MDDYRRYWHVFLTLWFAFCAAIVLRKGELSFGIRGGRTLFVLRGNQAQLVIAAAATLMLGWACNRELAIRQCISHEDRFNYAKGRCIESNSVSGPDVSHPQ